jgi:uncharacterized membrane protein YwaF
VVFLLSVFWSNFWTGSGGVTGDYAYGKIHLMSVAALIVATVLMCVIGKRLSKKSLRKLIITAAVISLIFEIFWRGVWVGHGVPLLETWPLYPCNLAGVLIPIIALTNNKTLKEIFYVFAFIGGIITFVYPEDIFVNSMLNFAILKSVLQHTAIIFIPVFEYCTGRFKPKFNKLWLAIIGLFIHLFNSEYVSRFLGMEGDFIFLRSGLPFTIQGIPQVFILGPLAVVVMFVFYAALDPKGRKSVIRGKRKR